MKSIKYLTAGLALLMGIALTSCNSKSDVPSTWAGIVRTNFDGSYTDAGGTKLIPTNPSALTTDNMVYIYCQINEEQPVGAKTWSITLKADPIGIDGSSYLIEPGAGQDKIPNVAFYTLSVITEYYKTTPSLFDKETLIVPMAFFLKNGVTNISLAEEMAKHKFELIYTKDSANPGDTELNVDLYHSVSDPEVERKDQKTWGYKAYDISDILTNFQQATGGSRPARIIIHVKENSSSDKLSEAKDAKYEINYTFDI